MFWEETTVAMKQFILICGPCMLNVFVEWGLSDWTDTPAGEHPTVDIRYFKNCTGKTFYPSFPKLVIYLMSCTIIKYLNHQTAAALN